MPADAVALSCAGLPLISELGSVTQYPASVMRARLERRRAIHSTPRRRQAWCARGRTVYTLVRNLPHTGVTITCHYHNYHRHHLVIIVTQYRVAMTPSLRAKGHTPPNQCAMSHPSSVMSSPPHHIRQTGHHHSHSWSSRNFSQYRRRDISRSLAIFSDFWRFMAMFNDLQKRPVDPPPPPPGWPHPGRPHEHDMCAWRVRDIARYCAILRDIARYCAILRDLSRYWAIFRDKSRSCENSG